MTTLSNALTSTINHERSPVLLTEEAQFATWLTEQAMGLITTSDPERMRIVQSRIEKKDLLEAAQAPLIASASPPSKFSRQ
jgi:putative SOS response-associated peptidase YedK